MSRSYKPSYKTPQPNPGGWITLLIIIVAACEYQGPGMVPELEGKIISLQLKATK